MDLEDELPTPSAESRTSYAKPHGTMLKAEYASISEPILYQIDEDQIPGMLL
jgi:hypothetical protein